jgi:hypothetical protein
MECLVCKKEIKDLIKKDDNIFCSKMCYYKYHCVGEKKCQLCGISYYTKHKKSKFCSKKCSSKINGYQKGHTPKKEWVKKMSETKRKKSWCYDKSTICESCGKKFVYRVRKYKYNKRFCSEKCLYKKGGRSGVPLSTEKKILLSIKYIGDNNPCWKGGLSKSRFPLYSGPKYRLWRKSVFERDNYTCQKCKKRGCGLEAHHIIPWSVDKKGWFDINNGLTLCKVCHSKITKEFMKINWKNQY